MSCPSRQTMSVVCVEHELSFAADYVRGLC